MDNVAHTLAGFAMAGTGLSPKTRFATAALVIGSNLPDADIVAGLGGRLAFIDAHRGISHSLVGGCLLGALLGAGLWALGRFVRPVRKGRHGSVDARLGPLIALAIVGVLVHLGFDALNDYGVRLLMPFTDRWFYGDTIFIVDPWFWLLLGGGAHLAMKRERRTEALAWMGWAALSIPVLIDTTPPMPARLLWLLGVGVVAALRFGVEWRQKRRGGPRAPGTAADPRLAWWPRAAIGLLALYVLGVHGLHQRALGAARDAALRRESETVTNLAVIPRPANPFRWNALYETPKEVVASTVSVLPSTIVTPPRRFARNLSDPRSQVALRTPPGRAAFRFCRYLFVDIEPLSDGSTAVSFRDARFTVRDRLEFSVFTVRVER